MHMTEPRLQPALFQVLAEIEAKPDTTPAEAMDRAVASFSLNGVESVQLQTLVLAYLDQL